jgi:branched-subunit amino acid transport protein AzlD
MNVLLAVLVVGVGSLVVRVVPLLGARRLPGEISRLAGWAGVSVLATLTVRAVVLHEDTSVPYAGAHAFIAVALALFVAYKWRSTVLAVGIGAAAYVVLSAATASLL